jgi:spore coat polysaccharide biosynthesis protein SpsF
MKAGVLIQARSASTRLPGKIYMPIPAQGHPLLRHVFERMKKADVGPVAFVIPEDDAELRTFLDAAAVTYFTGSHEDVRMRYRDAARALNLDAVVRATADNPCVDADFVMPSLSKLAEGLDLFSFSGLPLGMGVEVFTRNALEADGLDGPEYREHVSLHIKHDDRFRVRHDPFKTPLPAHTPRLTVDTAEDLSVVRSVFAALGNNFGVEEVLALFESNPQMFGENAAVEQRIFPKPGARA